jgi:hypothetical protein
MREYHNNLTTIRRLIMLFMISLFISGATAIPVDLELQILINWLPEGQLFQWIQRVHHSFVETKKEYPFLLYGYDWLAFAHLVLAILFFGPYRDPLRNIWVIEFGMIACVLIFPFAVIAGYYRGIPIGWRLIDCSFGAGGFFLLSIIYKRIIKTEAIYDNVKTSLA